MNHRPPYKLPALTADTLPAIMAERLAACRPSATSIPALWQGLLEMDVPLPTGRMRTAKLYIPEQTPQCTSFVLLNIPEGQDALSFLFESGWIACADQHQLPIFAAEPLPGGWDSPAAEQAYIEACAAALFAGRYVRAGMSCYLVGYGSIGQYLHQYLLNTPLRVAAAVFLNASQLPEHSVFDAEGASLDGNGMTFDIPKRDIPVPVWIFEDSLTPAAENVLRHWRDAICAGDPFPDSMLGTVYPQGRNSICTPAGPIARLCVRKGGQMPSVPEICSFLLGYSRYHKFGPYGNSLVPRVDFSRKGVTVRRYPAPDGSLRECLIYAPGGVPGKIPMVFAIHGFSESVRNYFEESLWYLAAEEYGFLLVMPETTLYPVPEELSAGVPMAHRPRWPSCLGTGGDTGDLTYLHTVMERVITEYPVDESRIYFTGHSNGCMMTNLFCSSPLGSRIAAAAATSGGMQVWDSTGQEQIPVYFTMGEYDLWPYALQEETVQTHCIDRWLIRNGLADSESARQVRINGASAIFCDGRHHCTQWADKDGIPMVCYDWIEKKDHMNTPEENRRFWEKWFCKWSLDENGHRRYTGTPIRPQGAGDSAQPNA